MQKAMKFSLVVVGALAVVSGYFWYAAREDRRKIDELQAQLAQEKTTRPPVARPSELVPIAPSPPSRALPPISSPASQPVVMASVGRPPAGDTADARRADALRQSALVAGARVAIWRNSVAASGQPLSDEQFRALKDAAIAELGRETEESIEIDGRKGPMDAIGAARLKEETINRQHETNLRILDRVRPQLTAGQANALMGVFEAWLKPQLAAARAERDRAANAAN
jgi:hypothetical protein